MLFTVYHYFTKYVTPTISFVSYTWGLQQVQEKSFHILLRATLCCGILFEGETKMQVIKDSSKAPASITSTKKNNPRVSKNIPLPQNAKGLTGTHGKVGTQECSLMPKSTLSYLMRNAAPMPSRAVTEY